MQELKKEIIKNSAKKILNKSYYWIIEFKGKYFYFNTIYDVTERLRSSLKFFDKYNFNNPLSDEFKTYLADEFNKVSKISQKIHQTKQKYYNEIRIQKKKRKIKRLKAEVKAEKLNLKELKRG